MSPNATHRLISSYEGVIISLIHSPSLKLIQSSDANQYSKSIISDSKSYTLKAKLIHKSLNSSVAFAQRASNIVSAQNYLNTSLYQELANTVSVSQSTAKSLAKSMIIGETRSADVSATTAAYKSIDSVTEITNVLPRQLITQQVTSSMQSTNLISISPSSMRTPVVKNIINSINSSSSINLSNSIDFVNNTNNAKAKKSIDIYNTTLQTHSIKVVSSSNFSKYNDLPKSNSDTRPYIISTRRMNTIDRSSSRMDTIDRSISVMDTVDRSTKMMDTVDRSTSFMDTVGGRSTSIRDTVGRLEYSTAVVSKVNTESTNSFNTHRLTKSQIQLSSKIEMKNSNVHSEKTEIFGYNSMASYDSSVIPIQLQITFSNQVKNTSPSKVKVAPSAKINMTSPIQVSFTSQKATSTGELKTMDVVTPRISNIITSKQYKTSFISFSKELSTSEFQQGVSSSSKLLIVSISISKDSKKSLIKSTSYVTLVSKFNTQSLIQEQPISYFSSDSSNNLYIATNSYKGHVTNSHKEHVTNSRKGHVTVESSQADFTSYSFTSASSYLQSKSIRQTETNGNTNLEQKSSIMVKRNSTTLLQAISSSNIQNTSLRYLSIQSSQVSAIYTLNASQKTSNLQQVSRLDIKPSTERKHVVTKVTMVTKSHFDTHVTITSANNNFTLLQKVHTDFIDINEASSTYSDDLDREDYFHNMPNHSRRILRPVSSRKTVITKENNSSYAVCLQISIYKVLVITFFAFFISFM